MVYIANKGGLPTGRADYIRLILGVGGEDLLSELDKDEGRSVISLLRLATEAGHIKCSEWLLKNGFRLVTRGFQGWGVMDGLSNVKIRVRIDE